MVIHRITITEMQNGKNMLEIDDARCAHNRALGVQKPICSIILTALKRPTARHKK